VLLKSSRTHFASLAAFAACMAAGCSGGSSSPVDTSTVEGLTIAESMSVVTVEETSGLTGGIAPAGSVGGIPTDSPYYTDIARSNVYDPSMESLETVNMILCLLKQTAYSGLVNEALYKAQIDQAACGDDDDGGTGQSSGDAQQLSVWVIDSSRASNSTDQIVEFWIPPNEGNGDEESSQVRVRMTISEGVSDENPFGVFDLNFMDIYVDSGELRGFGNLHTLDAAEGFIGFSFYEENGDVSVPVGMNEYANRVQANVNMYADQSQGVAHILIQDRNSYGGSDSGLNETEYSIAFDLNNVLRGQEGETPVCLSRTEFQQNTWRYNLYDSTTGERVELNSGFGFQTAEGDYGWVGYHGLWAPQGVTIESGDTVTRQTYGSDEAEEYTVFQAPGKLIRRTRNVLSLTSIGGVEFEWNIPPPPSPEPMPPSRAHVEYQSPNWVVTEFFDNKTQDWATEDPVIVIPTVEYGFLGMWCPELGGSTSFVHGDEFITFFSEETVTSTDSALLEGNIRFYGYFECLESNISMNAANMGDVYLDNSFDVNTPHEYEFDVETMTLHLVVSDEVGPATGLAEGVEVTQGPFTWGMRTGPLVTSTFGFESTFDIWGATVFYTYETGSNAWNRYTTLLDAENVAVSFDPPIQFSYTHTTGNDANDSSSFDGRTFLLNYGGPGDLHGIPYAGIDLNGDDVPDHQFPAFTIAAGVVMGPEGIYVLRASESEYTLLIAPGDCGALDIDTVGDLELPDETSWTNPNLGATPEVLDAPRVIEGELVGSDS